MVSRLADGSWSPPALWLGGHGVSREGASIPAGLISVGRAIDGSDG